ncbi:MAG: hypothetical protein KGI67_08855 [Pseudomonadota bacterium]|nr:hypothetical protein [Pseudomonadota bacterium]
MSRTAAVVQARFDACNARDLEVVEGSIRRASFATGEQGLGGEVITRTA